MSSPLHRLTRGRKQGPDPTRAAMLSRLGIAEERPADLFRQPDPEPQPAPEPERKMALAPAPAPVPEPAPEPPKTSSWTGQAANDEHIPAFPRELPAARTVMREAQTQPAEDPFEAIRRRYRHAPAGLPQMPSLPPLPSLSSLPSVNLNIPAPKFRLARPGVRRRKAGELPLVRKVIWGLSWAAGLSLGWALLTGDETSPVVQAFGMLLP